MSTLALLCGGQGTQTRTMFDIVAGEGAAEAIFEAATTELGRDPRAFVREADDGALHANRTGQLLCCSRSLAIHAALGVPARGCVFAGYSVGEVAAWACAGLFDAATLMRVISERAAAMDEADGGSGGLASVGGLRRLVVERLCEEHQLALAITIAPERFVVGGERNRLQPFCEAAMRAGARRAGILPVHIASHTPRLAQASARFGAMLAKLKLPTAPSEGRLISGIDGASVFDTGDGLRKLARQLSEPVDWQACLEACRAAGAETILDLGPGHALASMAADAFPDLRVHAAEDFRTIAGMREWLQRGRG